ncbi:unnamed protein product [Owenia fusiformis]|uniref:DNA topoisomerase n=1 Tax=Owenia fusiformis TaxID=6347 RepID=A0A8J1U5T1_OWEFU|nr:unnamed protein product [Owenia fusiformis]
MQLQMPRLHLTFFRIIHVSYKLLQVSRSFTTKPTMVRVLNVAEKNDAAKSISDIMSRGGYRRRDGFSVYNKIYEFDYNLMGQNVTMTMTSVSGHLLGLEFTGQNRKWHGCSIQNLFEAPVVKECPENFIDIKHTLEREVRGCQKLVIWTDGDREGENIGFEIIQVCTAVKPNIQVFRARFSEITPQAIARACANLQPPNKNISDAVDVRQELDLRIGAAFTRFQTLRLQKVFPDVLSNQVISYGSCQFPTLGFVVERYKQMQQFIAEPFWKIKVIHTSEDGTCEFSWKRVRLFEQTAVLVLYQHCLDDPLARVIEIKTKPKSKWRPVALDTVEMEKLGSRKLRIGAKETMKIAESLYTKGFISYPRTETNQFPKDLDLNALVQLQTADPNWGGFAANLLQTGATPRNGKKTDNAHPPIHPIKYTDSLRGNDAKLYEFIVRHFLACCSQDAQGQETTVEIDIAQERFTVSGLMILARNYLEVYPFDKWSDKVVPRLQQNETFQPTSIEMVDGETSAPSLLTEADLISLMEKHGIGTDATHAEHIEKIKERLYVGVGNDGRFLPGELGMGLVEGYDAMGFEMSKPHLRSELEADLSRICDGIKNKDVVLQEQVNKYKEVFMAAADQANRIDEALAAYFGEAQEYTPQNDGAAMSQPVMQCSICNSDMQLRTKKDGNGYFISCSGYPQCKNAIWLPSSVVSVEVSNTHCEQCRSRPRLLDFKFRRGSMPPSIPSQYTGCIGGCDDDLIESLDIKHQLNRTANQINTQQNRTQNARTQNNGTQNTRQGIDMNPPRNIGGRGANMGGRGGNNGGRGRTIGGRDSNGHGGNNQNTRGFGNNTQNTRNFSGASNASTRGGGDASRGRGVMRPPLQPVSRGGEGDGENSTVCNCGEDAVERTVRKEGPNTGRKFYACGKGQEGGCGFFLWTDQDGGGGGGGGGAGGDRGVGGGQAQNNQQQGHRYNRDRGPADYSADNQDDEEVKCNCNQPAKSLTVQKEGPNQGRPFYGCMKPRNEGQCGFFQWGDQPANPNPPGGRGGYSRGGMQPGGYRGGYQRSGGGGQATRGKRKCSVCHNEGHTKNKCPRTNS